MYGPRPKPANLAAQLGLSEQPSEAEGGQRAGQHATPRHASWSSACRIDDASNYRARVLVQVPHTAPRQPPGTLCPPCTLHTQ